MKNDNIFKPASNIVDNCHVDKATYDQMYKESIASPDIFWDNHGKRIDWIKPYTKVSNVSYKRDDVYIKWYEDGTLNASFNCLDRHLKTKGDATAIIWEGDDPTESKHISYKELHKEVCKFSNVLKKAGALKGDRITIYMPMIPEATIAMLACTRIGAIHSVVFGGFSPEALAGRIEDCNSTIIITADEGVRGGKAIPLKSNTDEAISKAKMCKTSIVVKRTGANVNWIEGQDLWYHEEMEMASDECQPTEMNAEDPMFILYTSGSTGKPKGVLHTTGGYMVYASMTHHYVFDYQENEIYWCTADVGWVTGHSYIVYGPLSNGATTLMFEGVPNYPSVSRFWEIVDKHKVNIFYTAPTAIRALMAEGDEPVNKTSRNSLRILGSVGEPINPEAWNWYNNVVGNGKCPIVDTWWQTETGGMLISPLPGLETIPLKPGSGTLSIPGVNISVVDENGNDVPANTKGYLIIKNPWPGMLLTLWGDDAKYKTVYWSKYENCYYPGDYALKDDDGYFWLLGRADDVLKVAGHRIGTAELESCIVSHDDVSESAVCGIPDEVKGEAIIAFVVLKYNITTSIIELEKQLMIKIRNDVGAIASPKQIYFVSKLPKTRSGKIMRRLLKSIVCGEKIGDTSTLEDKTSVNEVQSAFNDQTL